MSIFASILGLTTDPGNSASQTTGGATAAIDACGTATSRVIVINATQDVSIRFGSTTSVAAVSTDFRIPQNQTFTFTVHPDTRYFSLFNGSGSTATYYWAYLSQF